MTEDRGQMTDGRRLICMKNSKVLKSVVGIIFSSVFIYFSVRGLEFDKILEALRNVKYFYLIIATLLILSLSALRSLRWGIILSPIEKIGQKSLFPIYSIGLMAVVLVSMRMGEVVKAYLLCTNNHVPFSTALSTIFVERLLDILTILCILLMVVLKASHGTWHAGEFPDFLHCGSFSIQY